MRKRLVDFWFTLDLRSLGAFRVLLAVLLVCDWRLRWRDLEAFYSSTGVLPLAAPVPRFGGIGHLSLLDATDSLPVLRILFLLGLGAYLLLLVGWHTKLAQVASFVFFASVRARNPFISTGADTVLVTLALWALFLPLGARWSVDAARAALRRGVPLRDRERYAVPAPPERHRSLAAFAIVFQIALIYLTTAAAKTGGTWRDGTAVYYSLQLDAFATPLGRAIASAPLALTKALTWGTLAFEWLAMPLLLLPLAQPWLRRLAMIGLGGFHVGTMFTMVLGAFPHVMLASYALLLLPEEWDRLARWAQRRARPVVAYYDDTCGFCHRCCQVLALADRGRNIRFIGAGDRATAPHVVSDEEMQSSLVVFDPASGRKSTRAAAVAALFGALALPYHVLRVIALPGVVVVSNRVYDLVARHRYALSRRMGFTACGIDRVAESVPAPVSVPPRRPAARRAFDVAATGLTAALLGLCLVENWNQTLATFLGASPVKTPTWMRAPIQMLDLSQGWRMFAPNPLRLDGWWIVDADEPTGGGVDLLTGRPTRWEKPADLSTRHDIFWRTYLMRISEPGYSSWRPYFARWLVRRAERDGLPRARGFGFYFMQEDTLPHGSPRPFPVRRFLRWSYDAARDVVGSGDGAGP